MLEVDEDVDVVVDENGSFGGRLFLVTPISIT